MPKWSWFTGHLLVLQEYVERLPPDANVQLAMQTLALEKWGHTEIFLMDFWPVYPPFYMIFDPQTAYQVSNKFNMPKLPLHLKFMHPIVGGPSIHGMNHGEWKYWRSIFNPGFSASSMMDLVPEVVDSVQVFCDILKENDGSTDPVQLNTLTTRLTMEIILKVTLWVHYSCQLPQPANYQSKGHELQSPADRAPNIDFATQNSRLAFFLGSTRTDESSAALGPKLPR